MIAYGAYDQPTYHIDITPLLPLFAGRTVKVALDVKGQGDGKTRSIYSNWFISGNVKVWTGDKPTLGRLLEYHKPPLQETVVAHLRLDDSVASIITVAIRQFKLVSELDGRRVTFEQDLNHLNHQKWSNGSGKQRVEQLVHGKIASRTSGNTTFKDEFSYPLFVESDYSSRDHFGASIQIGYHRNLTHTRTYATGQHRHHEKQSHTMTDVVQKARGDVYLNDIGRVVNGTGQSSGQIRYSDDAGRRYEREVATKGISIMKDKEREWRYALCVH